MSNAKPVKTFGEHFSRILSYVLSSSRASIVAIPLTQIFFYVISTYIDQYLPKKYGDEYFNLNHWASQVVSFIDNYPFHFFLIPIGTLLVLKLLTSSYEYNINSTSKLHEELNDIEEEHNKEKNKITNELGVSQNLIASFGVFYFSDCSEAETHQVDWDAFLEKVSKHNTSELCILGATGQETFLDENSPLHKLVSGFRGRLKVLLLDPDSDSKAIATRVSGLTDGSGNKIKEQTYKAQIKRVRDYIQNRQKIDQEYIEIKFYDHIPSWKMVITDKYLWLQYYCPGRHVCDSPVYIVYKNNKDSLYVPFHREFQRIWNAAREHELAD